MESKVKIATRKVVNIEKNLKTALEKKNTRLVNKYALQLRDTLDELDQVCISAEVDGADQGADFLLKANVKPPEKRQKETKEFCIRDKIISFRDALFPYIP